MGCICSTESRNKKDEINRYKPARKAAHAINKNNKDQRRRCRQQPRFVYKIPAKNVGGGGGGGGRMGGPTAGGGDMVMMMGAVALSQTNNGMMDGGGGDGGGGGF